MNRATWLSVILMILGGPASALDMIRPGAVVADPPTIICLGVHWPYAGDDNKNASVRVRYRVASSGKNDWRAALPLFRIRPENVRAHPSRPAPAAQVAFAGSIFDLRPDTAYEIELILSDPDGSSVTKIVRSRTRPVPRAPAKLRVVNVKPGGLAAALRAARPGNVLLLQKGVYKGPFIIKQKATAAQPIVIRGVKRDDVILEISANQGTIITANDSAYVYFEQLTFRNAYEAIQANRATGTVMRRCRTVGLHSPFRALAAPVRDFYIADNLLEGPLSWPPPKGKALEEGIQIIGSGHVVCHNRVTGFGDAISIFRNPAVAIDVYGNDIDAVVDDGIEMDYTDRNTRCFRNRITNAGRGISAQPVYGGPCYIFRNEIYNIGVEAFKLHSGPSGVLIYHNTSYGAGYALVVWSSMPVYDTVFRNNLLIGRSKQLGDWTSKTVNCDLDYNGYGPADGHTLKIGNVRHASLKAAAEKGIETHGVMVRAPYFAGAVPVPQYIAYFAGVAPVPKNAAKKAAPVMLVPRRESAAIDAGVKLPNINDGYTGKAPDLGAREAKAPPPVYGPRPEGVDESAMPAREERKRS